MTENHIEDTVRSRREEIEKVKQQIADFAKNDIMHLEDSEIDYWIVRKYLRELLLNNLAMVKQTAGTEELVKFTVMLEILLNDILNDRVDLDTREINFSS